jgi:hypothetical protein
MDGFDDKAIIPRVVEKTPALSRRSQLGENVLVGQRYLQKRQE